ncbi:MAG: HAD family hydrolase [Verrucomicrobiae bacterium]|nr:HAD family hydrolase [Verrucomicrobiae bacterium]
MDYVAQLQALPRRHEFFIGIDSDGTVFDTMETKQKECFCPAFIKHFGLQAASRYAREVWEFFNLYSRDRGTNRFIALQKVLRLMAERDVFAERGLKIAPIPALDAWLAEETQPANPALEARVKTTGDPALAKVLAWSLEVNSRIKDLVHGVPPFPWVRQSLEKIRPRADVIVVSYAPVEALEREWREHNIRPFADCLAGQEAGSKSDHIRYAAAGRYAPDKMLVIGDAPGDLRAAQANHALFFPIIPGDEVRSWKRFHEEAADKFFNGTFAGTYQEELLRAFAAALPEKAPWQH